MAIVGALSGEAFALWALYRKLRYAGETGAAALRAMLAMLAVIFISVIVSNLQAEGALRTENILIKLYARYLAVISFAAVIVWGKLHMLKHDQTQREADARAIETALNTDLELSILEEQRKRISNKLTGTEISDAIDRSAALKAAAIVQRVTGQTVKVALPASRPPALEVRAVSEIDDTRNEPQYVNGSANPN